MNASGKAFLTHTLLAGKFTLRMAVGGARTELRHVKQAWELLVEIGREVMSSAGGETEPSSD